VILELLAEIGQERAVEILAPIMVAESPRHPNRISSRYDPIYGALALIEHCHLEAAMAALLTHEDETVRYMALALLFGEKPGDDNDELLEEVDQAPILDAPLAVKTAAEMLATTKNMDDADMAARALGRFRSSSTDGVQVLIDRWHYDDSSEEDHAWLQEIILIALAHQADPRAVPIFLETLTDERLHFRSNGYKGIAAVENAALVPLLNLWKTTQPHGQESLMLACALARLGDASGLQIMLDFLKRFEDLAGKPPSREPDAEDVVERQYEAHVCLDALSYLDEPRSNAVLEHWVMVEPYYRVLAIENDAVEGLARFTASLDSKVADRLFHDWVLAPTSKRSWNSRMIAARTLVMRNDPRIVGQLITMLDSPV
jgi:HEAT repeat protein